MPRQSDLAKAADMKQSRISMLETPGAANVTLETLSRIAAAFKVGVIVKFVPFSEMLAWENGFSQDNFDVVKIDNDIPFLNPVTTVRAAPSGIPIFYRPPQNVSPLNRNLLETSTNIYKNNEAEMGEALARKTVRDDWPQSKRLSRLDDPEPLPESLAGMISQSGGSIGTANGLTS